MDGAAWDIILKHGRIYGDINTFIQYPDSGDYETDATSLSVEYNKRIDAENGIVFEPRHSSLMGISMATVMVHLKILLLLMKVLIL